MLGRTRTFVLLCGTERDRTMDEFFDAQEPHSEVKTRLVEKYFKAWSSIILPRARGTIAYVDLFSGPGRYSDGSPSTPLQLLSLALAEGSLRNHLITKFNDMKAEHVKRLREEIDDLPGIDQLRYKPTVTHRVVGKDVMEIIQSVSHMPSLYFIDPFGYKGLSLDLIESSIRGWGCECIFFFNYNRINAGLSHPNPAISDLIDQVFGHERAHRLRQTLVDQAPSVRQGLIIEAIKDALVEAGGRFVLPFAVESRHGERPSHFIIFVTKHPRGHHIMKDVMRSVSTDEGDVRELKYAPVRSPQLALPLDLQGRPRIADLEEYLLDVCAGRSLSVRDIYEHYNVGTPFSESNFKGALRNLEARGAISINPPADERQWRNGQVTVGDKCVVTFPP